MQVTDRSGNSEFVNVKWRKPVAMLINGGTRSGKELLAMASRSTSWASSLATRTKGAVLTAAAFLIGSGLLLLAVEDFRVDGERLEGVTPTIPKIRRHHSHNEPLTKTSSMLTRAMKRPTKRPTQKSASVLSS